MDKRADIWSFGCVLYDLLGGEPQAVFDPRARRTGFGRQYEVTPDGSRFVVNRSIEPDGAESLSLVENWTRLLDR